MLVVFLGGAGVWLVSAAREVVTARASFERMIRQQDERTLVRGWALVDATQSRRNLADQPWRDFGLRWDDALPEWPRPAPRVERSQIATFDNLVFRRTQSYDPFRYAGMYSSSASVSIADHTILACFGDGPMTQNPVEVRQSRDLRRIEFRCWDQELGSQDPPQENLVEYRVIGRRAPSPGLAERAQHRAAIARFDRAVRVSGGLLGALTLAMIWVGTRTRRRRVLEHAGMSPMPYRALWQGPIRPAGDGAWTGSRLHVGITLLCALACGWVAWERRALQRLPAPALRPASPSEPSRLPLHSVEPPPLEFPTFYQNRHRD